MKLLGLDGGVYLMSMEDNMTFSADVAQTLVKSLVFGGLVAFIATYRGYIAEPTSAGVSAATTQTVVVSSVAILVFDFIITSLWGV